MGVQLKTTFDKLVELVDQLSRGEQKKLFEHLLQQSENRNLAPHAKLAFHHASIISVLVNGKPSIRREDWYGDDGR